MKRIELFKYIPSKYVESFTKEGKILFRNLTYFKEIENDGIRGDELEGTHRDEGINGEGGLMTLKDGKKIKTDFFDNSINSDKIFVFCLSNVYDEKLFDDFKCDACVKITDTREFINLCRIKVALLKGKISKLYFNNVEYYDFTKQLKMDLKETTNIPLFKRKIYESQNEFRLYFAENDGFKITKKITIKNSNPFNLLEDKTSKPKPIIEDRVLSLGNIRHITEVIYKNK